MSHFQFQLPSDLPSFLFFLMFVKLIKKYRKKNIEKK